MLTPTSESSRPGRASGGRCPGRDP
jgi:hypothetical protein